MGIVEGVVAGGMGIVGDGVAVGGRGALSASATRLAYDREAHHCAARLGLPAQLCHFKLLLCLRDPAWLWLPSAPAPGP